MGESEASLPCVGADRRSHGFCSRLVQQFVPAEAGWKKPAMDKFEKCDYLQNPKRPIETIYVFIVSHSAYVMSITQITQQ